MTALQDMSDEIVIEAAIQLLQQKLRFIRCLSQPVSSEEYKSMRALDKYCSETIPSRDLLLPIREKLLPIR